MCRRLPIALLVTIALALVAFPAPASAGPGVYAGRSEWVYASWVVADERPLFAYSVIVRRRIGPVPTQIATTATVQKSPCTIWYGDYICEPGRRLKVQLETDEFWLSPALTEAHMEFEHRGSVFRAEWVYRGRRLPAVLPGAGPGGVGVAVWHSGWYARVRGTLFGQHLERSEGRGIFDTWTSAGARVR